MLTNKDLVEWLFPRVGREKDIGEKKESIEEYEKRKLEEYKKLARRYGLASIEEYLALEKLAQYIGKSVESMFIEGYFEVRNGHVTYLKLRELALQSLPEEIGKFKYLKLLDVYGNYLEELPKSIGNLENLEILVLTSNRLKELPYEIGELKKLRKLYLEGNKIRELPKSIGDLENLKELYVGYNELTELPPEIKNLRNLEILNVRGNSLSESSKKLLDELKNRGVKVYV